LSAVPYIVRNPLARAAAGAPREWRWSSHRVAFGSDRPWFLDTRTLLAYFGSTRTEARELAGALRASGRIPRFWADAEVTSGGWHSPLTRRVAVPDALEG
jgi:hypothetical protein